MPAGGSYAAAEKQPSFCAVQHGLPRDLGVKSVGFHLIEVAHDGGAGNLGRAAPQIGVIPTVGRSLGPRQNNDRGGSVVQSRHHDSEFANRGARARAFGVSHDHNRG
jgi:hypothetical protein